MEHSLKLKKKNKLCSVIAIDALFKRDGGNNAAIAFPLRAVWRINPARKADTDTPKFFISVPKKKLRHAVDRVAMRRKIREAYRLNRTELFADLKLPVDIAFIYVADCRQPYEKVNRSMIRLMRKIAEKSLSETPQP